MQTLLLLVTVMTAAPLPGGNGQGQSSQRVYLSEVLEPTTKGKAAFYLDPAGMEGNLYLGKTFTKKGDLKAEGHYADVQLKVPNGRFIFYHENGKVECTGEYAMGRKSGVWQRWDEWGRELAEKVYNPDPLRDIVYAHAETMPQYPGGQKELVQYIKTKANTNGVSVHGTVTASFVVETNGELSEVKVLGGGEQALDERVAEALKSSVPWQPGADEKGLPVRVAMRVPVPF